MLKTLRFTTGMALLFLTFLASCSKDDSATPTESFGLPQVTTAVPDGISGISVILGGNVTGNGGTELYRKGVCWSAQQNPTVDGNDYQTYNSAGTGAFTITISYGLLPNTTYYTRAFAENQVGISYGATEVFTTGSIITTNAPQDIMTTQAVLYGAIDQDATTSNRLVGFVYATTSNPTVNNRTVSTYITGPDNFELVIADLTPDTVYYVRSYTQNPAGGYFYGNQMQFRTTGYYGPAGGYVAYDKGITADGWRYLEIHPTTLNYNIAYTTGAAWGGYNTFISGTSSQVGAGVNNTALIAATATQANCAAKLCQNLTRGGFSDWFLPSSGEALLIHNSLLKAGINFGDYAWTSTQKDAQYAVATVYRTGPPRFETFDSYPKSFDNLKVYPVRRY